jgi:4-alpha-glucanotransferase
LAANAGARLRIGLYRDLAVGSDANGAETWSAPALTARGVHVGAPPDPFSATGQNWGLPPLDPRRMRAEAYASFIELVRANMRHAGALRIDHAMALQRLYWIPEGMQARDGAYVDYPCADLFAIIALESQRARCIVIGEDLGVVPPGFRERMAAVNMLSYRVLRFENRDGRLIPPADYPRLAIAVAGNHDLPTLKGWWQGNDLALQAQHGHDGIEAQQHARAGEKAALLDALEREGLIESRDAPFDEIRIAVHRYLGRSPALLALAQIEDIAGEDKAVNAPNIPQYPSWRYRLGKSLEEVAGSEALASISAALAAERPLLRPDDAR